MNAVEAREFRGRDGIRLVGDVCGDPGGAPVILLHGGGQTRHSWSGAQVALAAAGHLVINMDARGHGDSAWSEDGVYSLDVLADDLMCIIETLSKRPALVGASMGGATLLTAAGRVAPKPVASALVLVDIVPRVDPAGVDKIRAFMQAHQDGFASLDEAAAAIAAYNPHRRRKTNPAGLLKNLRERDGRYYWHWDPALLSSEQAPEPPSFEAQINAVARDIKTPTLLVRGLSSDIVSDEGVAAFRALMPHAEIADVAGAGHMVVGDRNDAFNDCVLAFLRQHAAES